MVQDPLAQYLKDQETFFKELEIRAEIAEAPLSKEEVKERMRQQGYDLRKWAGLKRAHLSYLKKRGIPAEEAKRRLDRLDQAVARGEFGKPKPLSEGQ